MMRLHERLAPPAVVFLLCCFMAACGLTHSDQSLTAEIQARLDADPVTRTSNVKVSVEGGVATLSGAVSNSDAVRKVLAITSGTSGIKGITNRLSLGEMADPEPAPGSLDPNAPIPLPPPSNARRRKK
jgi:hypothetical protein